MKRRFLPSIFDHNGREGAYATEWEGWVPIARIEVKPTYRINRTAACEAHDKLEDKIGCYVILHETNNTTYVLYVGYSKITRSEVVKRLREMGLENDDTTTFSALYIPSTHQATHYEDELIRYYAPPWNTKFHKQG